MNKSLIFSAATLVATMFGQSVFAETDLELSQDDLIAASQGYILIGNDERPIARRSALFAHILDSQKDNGTTMASSSAVVSTPEG